MYTPVRKVGLYMGRIDYMVCGHCLQGASEETVSMQVGKLM